MLFIVQKILSFLFILISSKLVAVCGVDQKRTKICPFHVCDEKRTEQIKSKCSAKLSASYYPFNFRGGYGIIIVIHCKFSGFRPGKRHKS